MSWCEITRTPLTGWEAEAMMQIRSRYDSMKNKASKKDFPAPYISEEREDEEAQRLAQSVEAQFKDLWAKAK